MLMSISSPRALAGHPAAGAIFESAVVAEIRKQCALLSLPPTLSHWRTHGGAEVDLVLERDGILFPVEIKARSHPSRADTSGILAFRKTHPQARIARGLVIAPCETSYPVSEQVCAVWSEQPDRWRPVNHSCDPNLWLAGLDYVLRLLQRKLIPTLKSH